MNPSPSDFQCLINLAFLLLGFLSFSFTVFLSPFILEQALNLKSKFSWRLKINWFEIPLLGKLLKFFMLYNELHDSWFLYNFSSKTFTLKSKNDHCLSSSHSLLSQWLKIHNLLGNKIFGRKTSLGSKLFHPSLIIKSSIPSVLKHRSTALEDNYVNLNLDVPVHHSAYSITNTICHFSSFYFITHLLTDSLFLRACFFDWHITTTTSYCWRIEPTLLHSMMDTFIKHYIYSMWHRT